MQNKKKKVLSFLLAFFMAFSGLTILITPGAAAEETPEEGIPHGEAIYQNDFESPDPLEGWTSSSQYSVQESGGNHVLKGSDRKSGALSSTGPKEWKNNVVEADVNTSSEGFNESGGGASAGIVFGYQDTTHFYHFRLDSTGNAQLYQWNGKATRLANTPFQYDQDRTYHLSVVKDGGSIQCYIDGERVISYEDAAVSQIAGGVGFRTYNCSTSYDNLNVWRLADPETDITSVSEGQTVTQVPVTVSGTVKNAHSAELAVDGGSPVSLNIVGDTFSYRFYPQNGVHKIKVTAYNHDKTLSRSAERSFTVSLAQKPLTAKLGATQNVAVDSPVSVIFDKPVKEDTIDGIQLKQGENTVSSTVALDEGDPSGCTVSIVSENPLELSRTYTVEIGARVEDYLGSHVETAPLRLSFDTAKDVNTLPILEGGGEGQTELSLNGTWKFAADPNKIGETNSWYRLEDTTGWDTLSVPGNWDLENAYADYKGTGWYGRTFQISEDYVGYPVYLNLTAVYHNCEIWINGQKVGAHDGGYTTFEFRVDQYLKFGEENTIAIMVNNEYTYGEFGVGAWWKWGGISGGALLRINNTSKFDWQHVVSTPNLKDGTAKIDFTYKINNQSSVNKTYTVVSEVYDKKTGVKAGETSTPVTVKPSAEETDQRFTGTLSLPADKVKLWRLDDPHLYAVKTSLKSSGETVSYVENNIGIREIRMDDTYFYLNGEKLRLTGADRIWDDRANGQTEPDYVIKRDIDYMKSMGMNCARMSHVPMSRNILDYCDEVGFLLIVEGCVWGDPPEKDDTYTYRCAPWYREMIERDYNHPAIFAWSIGNELHGNKQETKDYARFMVNYIKTELDSSRLVTEVTYTAQNAKKPEDDSIYYSDFICCTCYGGFRSRAEKMRSIYPDKPIFFAEYGSSQTSEVPDKAVINPQNALNELGGLPYVFGASIWTLNDYRSHFQGTPLGQNRPWGVTTVWGDKKIGFDALRKASSPVKTLSVSVSGDTNQAGSTAISLIQMQIKDFAKELSAYPLRGANVKWEAIDREGRTTASGLDALPDLQPDGSSHTTTAAIRVPEDGIAAIHATVIDSLGYEIAETFKYLQAPSSVPKIKEVVTTGTGARILFDGVDGATDYTVTAAGGGKTFTGTAKLNRYVDFSGLSAGQEYTFTLTAKNEAGAGAPSEAVKVTTDAGFDALPPILWHTEPVEGAFFVGYSVKNAGDTYEIEYGTQSGVYPQSVKDLTTQGAAKVSGLTGGQTYYYRMRSISGGKPSAWSEEIAVKTETADQQRAVPVVKGAAAGENTVSLTIEPSWKSTGYTVKYGTSKDAPDHTLYVDHAEVEQLTVPNLSANTTYYFSVASHNGDLLSAYSAPVSAKTSSAGGETILLASVDADTLDFFPHTLVQEIPVSAWSTFDGSKTLTVKVENLPQGVSVPADLSFTVEKEKNATYRIPVTVSKEMERRPYQGKVTILNGNEVIATRDVTLNLINSEPLFEDDFSNLDKSRYTQTGSAGTFEQEDGKLLISASGGTTAPIVTAGESNWTDYAVESDMRLTDDSMMSSGSGISAGLVFRYQDDKNYYHVRINRNADSEVVSFIVYKWVDGTAEQVFSIPLTSAWNDPYHLRAVVTGSTAKVYLNGQWMTTVDVTLPSGKAGYRSYGCAAEFDNLFVYRLTDPVQVDKSRLQELVSQYGAYPEDKYTASSFADFKSALDHAAAVLADGNANSAQAAKAEADLESAAAKLVKLGDKTDLNALLAQAKAKQLSDYTKATAEKLREAIQKAEAVAADSQATEADVAKAAADLQDAISKLVKLGDKTGLNALLVQAKAKRLSDYTEAAAEKLREAIQKAESVAADDQATEADVAKAEADLQNAISELVKLGDKTDLNALLVQAKGKRLSDYTEATAEKLREAIQKAEAVAADSQATEAGVAAAAQTLRDALSGLKAKGTASSENPSSGDHSSSVPSSGSFSSGNLPSSGAPSGNSSSGGTPSGSSSAVPNSSGDGANPQTGTSAFPAVGILVLAVVSLEAVVLLRRRK